MPIKAPAISLWHKLMNPMVHLLNTTQTRRSLQILNMITLIFLPSQKMSQRPLTLLHQQLAEMEFLFIAPMMLDRQL
jgi:hypothetical protein